MLVGQVGVPLDHFKALVAQHFFEGTHVNSTHGLKDYIPGLSILDFQSSNLYYVHMHIIEEYHAAL